MWVAMKTEFFLSPTGVSSLVTRKSFVTSVDSPVNTASSAFKSTTSRSRPSAGTRSPASKSTMSPGTISREGIITSLPSRSTRVLGAVNFFIASKAFSDLYSLMKPTTALRITIVAIIAASISSPMAKEITVAMISMITKTSLN